jgi:glycosyltransferase involved in cell wall biosynthesis
VVWAVRHDGFARDKALTRATRRMCALLSRFIPERIVFNSEAALRSHARAGYAANKLLVIPNGFDVARFRPDSDARAAVRHELGLGADTPVVGLVARFHPDKDHATFATAARAVLRDRPDVRFVLCGAGVTPSNAALAALFAKDGVKDAMHLLGERPDVERVLAAVDVACLSSRTESFPNVLGEAMACGVPCVATDCGDVRNLLDGVGSVVPTGAPGVLAASIVATLGLGRDARAALGAAARRRVIDSYGIKSIAARFREVQDGAARAR